MQRASVEVDSALALQLIVNVILMSVGIAGSGSHFVSVFNLCLLATSHCPCLRAVAWQFDL